MSDYINLTQNKYRQAMADRAVAHMAMDIAELIDSGDYSKQRDGKHFIDMTGIVMMLCRRAVTQEAHGKDESSEKLLRAVATALTLWMEEHAHQHGHNFKAVWEEKLEPHNKN